MPAAGAIRAMPAAGAIRAMPAAGAIRAMPAAGAIRALPAADRNVYHIEYKGFYSTIASLARSLMHL